MLLCCRQGGPPEGGTLATVAGQHRGSRRQKLSAGGPDAAAAGPVVHLQRMPGQHQRDRSPPGSGLRPDSGCESSVDLAEIACWEPPVIDDSFRD